MDYFQKAFRRAKRVRSPWNLLQIPLTIGGIFVICQVLLRMVLLIIGFFNPYHATLDGYRFEDTREFIVIPLIFAAMPLGMMFSNMVFWVILPLRKIQEQEAIRSKGTDFGGSMRGLGLLASVMVPAGLGVSFLVAALGH